MAGPGRHYGNSFDGDSSWTDLSYTQSGNQTTVSWGFGWGFHPPSPTDRDLRNGYYAINNKEEYNESVVHNNSGQYWEHDITIDSGSFTVTHDADGNHSAIPVYGRVSPYYDYNFNSKSEFSFSLDIPRIAVKPGQMPAPALSKPTATGMTLTFTNPSDGGSALTHFDIQYSLNSDFSSATTVETCCSPYDATGLTAGRVYYFRIRAANGVGDGEWSPSSNKVTLPPAPTGLVLKDSTTNSMVADWDAPSSATSYDIQYGVNSDFSGATTTTSDTSIKTLTGLTASKKYYVRVRAKNDSGTGAWGSSANRVTIPVAPTSLAISNPTTSGFRITWVKPAGGSEITNYDIQWDDNSSFSSPVDENSPDLVQDLTGMNPGTKYYVRVRAENAVGTGGWSSTASATTLPAVAPGLKIASSPDGTQATLTFSPPGGVTGVDKYDWERRVKTGPGSGGSGSEADTSETVSSLTPGTTYEWRASAWIDAYQSPWTGWIALTQAKPNTNAGDYFDGDTADTQDITYDWTGTPENSTSTATGSGVKGWGTASPSNAGQPVMYRITGGVSSPFAARVVITADMTAAGLFVGQKNADPFRTEVTADATYVGSIYVRPNRSQRLQAALTWMDDAGSTISTSKGAETVVPGGNWLRLAVGDVAPAGATKAIVRAVDVEGSSWSVWIGGDVLDVDSAMISLNEEFPYFDGSTPSNNTYIYEWDDPTKPHESISKRTPVEQVAGGLEGYDFDPLFLPSWLALTDPDCEPVPPPPRPPAIPSDCIEDVGVWRRYYTEVPADYVPDWMDVVPTVIITSGSQAARQLRIRYHANPDGLSTEDVPVTDWIAEQIISFMPANTVMTLDGVTQRVWAEVNGGNAVSADHLLYGTNGQPATWPLLSCGIAYLITVDVPIAEEPGNIIIEVALTARV